MCGWRAIEDTETLISGLILILGRAPSEHSSITCVNEIQKYCLKSDLNSIQVKNPSQHLAHNVFVCLALSNHWGNISPALQALFQVVICLLRATKPFNTHSGSNMSEEYGRPMICLSSGWTLSKCLRGNIAFAPLTHSNTPRVVLIHSGTLSKH